MLILDNIKEQDREKFTSDFGKLLENYNNVNVSFNFNIELFKYKSILFKFNDYDNVEKKIIRTIICFFLMKDCWQYVDVKKYETKDKNYYTIFHYDTIIRYEQYNCSKKICGYRDCNMFKGYGIIYDKINNVVNYYSKHITNCMYHCAISNNIDRLYNLNSLFSFKYKNFKLQSTKNNNIVTSSINNTNCIKTNTKNNDNNNIIPNANNNDTKIIIEIITNTTNFTIEFINMDLEQVFNKLITSFHKGKIICDNGTYKFIKS